MNVRQKNSIIEKVELEEEAVAINDSDFTSQYVRVTRIRYFSQSIYLRGGNL
jgi:hypothetical protein